MRSAACLVLAAFAALSALGGVACSATDASGTADETALGTARSAVIKGTASPATQDSVVMIQMGQDGFCSGTLIAPNVVLTARHCVSNYAEDDCGTFTGDIPPSTEGIAIGGGANEQSTPVAHAKKYFYVDAAKGLCDPAVDIAVIMLDRDVTGVPIAKVRAAAVTVGETFTAVGYGEDENKQVSIRRQRTGVTSLAVGPVTKTFTPTNAPAYTYELPLGEIAVSEAVCHGDSGGPLFDTQNRIVGVTSRGTDPNDVCVARPDIFSAVAQHMDVIDRALVAAGHPRAPETTTTPQSDTDVTGGDESDSDTDADEEEAPAPKKTKKKSSLAAQPSAGCAVAARETSPARANGSGLAGTGLALALALVLRRRRAT